MARAATGGASVASIVLYGAPVLPQGRIDKTILEADNRWKSFHGTTAQAGASVMR